MEVAGITYKRGELIKDHVILGHASLSSGNVEILVMRADGSFDRVRVIREEGDKFEFLIQDNMFHFEWGIELKHYRQQTFHFRKGDVIEFKNEASNKREDILTVVYDGADEDYTQLHRT